MMKTPAASTSSGTIRPAYVLYIPSWLITRNFGMSSTTPGTAMTATSAANTVARPGKRSLASAYPASESKNTRPAVTKSVTVNELRNQSGKSE